MAQKKRDPHPTLPKPPRPPAPPKGTGEHEEWMLDEAVEESFPASDPPEPAQPGSALAEERHKGEDRKTRPVAKGLAKKKKK
jgi:hypothetical protein